MLGSIENDDSMKGSKEEDLGLLKTPVDTENVQKD